MSRRPRIAVIGAGAWGMNHVRAVLSEDCAELACVADHDPIARRRVLEIVPGVTVVEDADRVLADPTVEAVIIATPASTHGELACNALREGKHVLVEKPLATTLRDARRVAEVSAVSSCVAMVGHLMVFHPAVTRLRELLRTESLGRLRYVHSIRANAGRIRDDESALWSFGPHDLSMLDYLLEAQPVRVSAHGQQVIHPRLDDVVFVTLEYDSHMLAHLHLSRVHPRKERALNLVCERTVAQFDDVAQVKLRIFHRAYDLVPCFTNFAEYLALGEADVETPQFTMEEPLRLQLRHFVRCMLSGASPLTNAASALRVVEVLDAVQRSLDRGGAPVELHKRP